jgi:uncharacterized protein (TIGR01244 family)
MNETTKFSDQITVGPQPTEDELQKLQSRGFKTIVNFRHDGEDQQPLSPDAEGQRVEKLGMAYLHVPVSMSKLTPALVDQFRREFRNISKPVYAHCKLGTRAGLMVIMHTAVEQGLTGRQALEKATQLGFKPQKVQVEQFLTDYVDSRSEPQ